MLLALDMGNTNITIGVYEKDSLRFESRRATDLSLIHISSFGREQLTGKGYFTGI